MKKLILILTVMLIISSCNKDDNPFMGKDQLPPATQTGANTAGCTINGQVFIPKQEGLSPSLQCNYEYINNEFYFTFRFSDFRKGGSKSVMLETKKIALQINQIYQLNKNIIDNGDFIGSGGMYWLTPNTIYYTNTIQTGELKITQLNLSKSIISGTFWFDAVNAAGEKVEIREGRFDMQY